jgi:hypothetical protein
MFTALLIAYFLLAIYFAQNTCFFFWHVDTTDRVLEYLLVVFWLPAALAVLLLNAIEWHYTRKS